MKDTITWGTGNYHFSPNACNLNIYQKVLLGNAGLSLWNFKLQPPLLCSLVKNFRCHIVLYTSILHLSHHHTLTTGPLQLFAFHAHLMRKTVDEGMKTIVNAAHMIYP